MNDKADSQSSRREDASLAELNLGRPTKKLGNLRGQNAKLLAAGLITSQTNCRFFNGYKPCGLSETCTAGCASYQPVTTRILIIHLGALGAVVRSTALLKAIKRKFPQSHVTWVTDTPAEQILTGHPVLDRVLTTSVSDQLILSALQFDVAFVIDKSLKAAGVLALTHSDLVYGFTADARTGALLPATAAAQELWEIGLSNQKKFFENKKPETQLIAEALELAWQRDPYWLHFSEKEHLTVAEKKLEWSSSGKKKVVGINTGCSAVIPAKKMTVSFQRQIIEELLKNSDINIVLLGGPEDVVRNQEIAAGLPVIQSECLSGLRDGATSVAACDVVFSGDSLGLHLAIAAQVYAVAWFGPTCEQEIDLYDRGEALLAEVACRPCWKRSCSQEQMCYDKVDLKSIVSAITRGLKECQPGSTSSSKLLFSATSSFRLDSSRT